MKALRDICLDAKKVEILKYTTDISTFVIWKPGATSQGKAAYDSIVNTEVIRNWFRDSNQLDVNHLNVWEQQTNDNHHHPKSAIELLTLC